MALCIFGSLLWRCPQFIMYTTQKASRIEKTMNGGYYPLSFFSSSHYKLDCSTGMLRIWRSRTTRCLAPIRIDSGQCSCLLQAKNGRKNQLVDADNLCFVSCIVVSEMQVLNLKKWPDILDLELPPIYGSSPAWCRNV